MFVKQYGRGSAAFFCLHGWSGDHRSFEPLLPYLPQDARMLSADLPGCGDSPDPAAWDVGTIAREIVGAWEITAAITGGPVTIIGNCIGALLAMRAALERPELVRRLVIMDVFAEWPWYFRVFTAPGWGKYAYATTFANPIGRLITNGALASKRAGNSNLTEGFTATRHDAALKYLHVLREIKSPVEFSSLRMPVDLLFGSNSFRLIRDSAVRWQTVLRQTRAWEIPHAGHLLLREAAGEVANIIFQGGTCEAESARISTRAHL